MTSPPSPPGMAPSPTRRRVVTVPAPVVDTSAATPAMTLAAVGRPPAAASPSDPNSGPPASSAAVSASAPAEVVKPITSFDEYMEMLTESAERVAVLKFFAPWCRSCRAIAPKVVRLAHEFPEILFYEIDYEANKVRLGCCLGVLPLRAGVDCGRKAGDGAQVRIGAFYRMGGRPGSSLRWSRMLGVGLLGWMLSMFNNLGVARAFCRFPPHCLPSYFPRACLPCDRNCAGASA